MVAACDPRFFMHGRHVYVSRQRCSVEHAVEGAAFKIACIRTRRQRYSKVRFEAADSLCIQLGQGAMCSAAAWRSTRLRKPLQCDFFSAFCVDPQDGFSDEKSRKQRFDQSQRLAARENSKLRSRAWNAKG